MAAPNQAPSSPLREDLLTRQARGWAKLHVWGNSKVVQSSIIWVLVTPICAKLLNAIYTHLGITLSMPLNFVLLYFAAVAFAIASTLYAFLAPAIFKHAPTYSAFMVGHHSHLELKNWFHELAKFKRNGETVVDAKRIQNFLRHLNGNDNLDEKQAAEVINGAAGHALLDPFWWRPPSQDVLPFLYEITVNAGDAVHPKARLVASICYLLGFGLVGAVALLNTLAMCAYILRMIGCCAT